MPTRKTVDIRLRVDTELKERWQVLCELNSWNGSDKIRKFIEQLVWENYPAIEQEKYIREQFKNNE